MRKTTAVLGSVVFFVIAPCVGVGLIPWWITRWQVQTQSFGLVQQVVGAILIVAGVPGLVDSFARFALQGLGTPAPFAPPRNLVVTGLYRYVRNPMYVSIVALVLGQAALLGDGRLVAYGAIFWLVSHVFVVSYEEPALKHKFGAEYEVYRANVPRWIPRVTAWSAQ
jgi:protein-S-isoprenylcysteine O-methyltransferase Ste14